MITIYKKKEKKIDIITVNDSFFNKYTVELLDERAVEVVAKIDSSIMISKYMIKSRFDGATLNIDKLSTGCKTVLNILYNSDKIFDIRECGENAIDMIYELEEGNVFCDYPLISFNMQRVLIHDGDNTKEISDYDELKEWWTNED